MSEEVKFCPMLTIVRAGQASYLACQYTTCVFFVDDECVFITTAKLLKEMAKQKEKSQRIACPTIILDTYYSMNWSISLGVAGFSLRPNLRVYEYYNAG